MCLFLCYISVWSKIPFHFCRVTVSVFVFHFKKGFTNQISKSPGTFPACNTKHSESVIFETTRSFRILLGSSESLLHSLSFLSVCLSVCSAWLEISVICFRGTCAPPAVLQLSLALYIFLSSPRSVAALIPVISLNIQLHAEKSIFSKAPRLTSANIDGKQTNQYASVDSYMEPARGPHLPALKRSAGCIALHLIRHYCCHDAGTSSVKFQVPPPKQCAIAAPLL